MGEAGSRSSVLHDAAEPPERSLPTARGIRPRHAPWFRGVRLAGTAGALLLGFAGLGAGAMPVVDNPFPRLPGGGLLAPLLQASTVLALVGIALMVAAWLCLAPLAGAPLRSKDRRADILAPGQIWRIFWAWSIPLVATAPLFTQDIYSYLAQGSIVDRGLDPYEAGPVEILPENDPLARSVPFIWAQSPSPYGPVALGVAGAISSLTDDNIYLGILAHRVVSIAALGLAGWALARLAGRCGLRPTTALWLGLINPLTILHLVGGIHNESLMLGLMLAGFELGLVGLDRARAGSRGLGWALFLASGALISCAGMVKVTALCALGFTGTALARDLCRPAPEGRGTGPARSLAAAVGVQVLVLVATIAAVTLITGIGLGWITGQGGAAAVTSWMSLSTAVGLLSSLLGMLLGLGDHSDATVATTQLLGLAVGGAFMVRMLWATFRGRIHPLGGLGVAMFVLVVFFPVVHPWYLLWAILPLAAWANRTFFHVAVACYTALFSFLVLPRGLALPPLTVIAVYLTAAAAAALLLAALWLSFKRWVPRPVDSAA
mgnify:CR=1 FL=1